MNRKLSMIVMLLCAAGFALGIAELFKLRFESGDVYPAYSSLRTDPLGASALYEGLERMPGLAANRDYSANNELPEGRETAYLHLAGRMDDWEDLPEDTFHEVDAFLRKGGRLVVAFYPQPVRSFTSTLRLGRMKLPPPGGGNTNATPVRPDRSNRRPTGADASSPRTVSLTERWGVKSLIRNLRDSGGGAYEPVVVINTNEPSLPRSVAWHSGQVFTNLDPAWRVLYARGSDPVLIERRFGPGSVVFSSDSYFLSNEAMQKDRHAELLAWLVGPSRRVFFDEAHLGIVEKPGVAMLVRQYRLDGFVAGLLVLAGLFIWKNSVPLAPTAGDRADMDFVTGKDSAAGFVNLLRRHVPYGEVLHVCLTEWRKSKMDGKYSAVRLARAQAVIDTENARPFKDRDAIRTYQDICRALNERPGAAGPPPAAIPPAMAVSKTPA